MAKEKGKVRQVITHRIVRPMAEFIRSQASGGVLLLACTAVAIIWANSGFSAAYVELWSTRFGLDMVGASLSLTLQEWINEALMAVFFLLVGLEIKREFLVGELSGKKTAALPVLAAVGGMVVPALIYFAFNRSGPAMEGWAIPMATDIAFSLGILSLFGSRAPIGIKVFLTALAIVDDLGAVVVIALFYSHQIDVASLLAVGGLVAFLALLNVMNVRNLVPYVLTGAFLWVAMHASGIHATIAGVILALAIPTRVRLDAKGFLRRNRELLERFQEGGGEDDDVLLSEERQSALHAIERSVEQVQMPLQRLEHMLHVPVNFFVMPVFALANAGIIVQGVTSDVLAGPVTIGVSVGLLFGKAIGITLFSWLAVRVGLAALPKRVKWSHIVGVAFLGGIGFTMSLFIAGLAFQDAATGSAAKFGILLGSAASGIIGAVLISRVRGDVREQEEEKA